MVSTHGLIICDGNKSEERCILTLFITPLKTVNKTNVLLGIKSL